MLLAILFVNATALAGVLWCARHDVLRAVDETDGPWQERVIPAARRPGTSTLVSR